MNNRIYLIPGFRDWYFKTSDTGCGLWSELGGPCVPVTSDTPTAEIAQRIKSVLWLRYKLSDDEAEKASKAILGVDWQAMIREAGTDVQHQSPSLPGWTLKISDLGTWLWHIDGAGVPITSDTPIQEIAEGVRRVLLPILPPVEIDVQVDEFMRINFKKLILNAWGPKVAPLLEGFTADNTAFVESICADLMHLVALQKNDSTALGNEICALIKKLA